MSPATKVSPVSRSPQFRQNQSGRDPFEAAGQYLLGSGVGTVHSDLLSSELRHSVRLYGEHAASGDHLVVDQITLCLLLRGCRHQVSRAEARRYVVFTSPSISLV